MWMVLILAGVSIIIFQYFIQKRRERTEDRQDRLKELRQKHLDLLLNKEDKESSDSPANKSK